MSVPKIPAAVLAHFALDDARIEPDEGRGPRRWHTGDDYLVLITRGRRTVERSLPNLAAEHFAETILYLLDDAAKELDWLGGLDMARSPAPHTMSIEMCLLLAERGTKDQIAHAQLRGDIAGADAWALALDTIVLAKAEHAKQHKRQTWIVQPEPKAVTP